MTCAAFMMLGSSGSHNNRSPVNPDLIKSALLGLARVYDGVKDWFGLDSPSQAATSRPAP